MHDASFNALLPLVALIPFLIILLAIGVILVSIVFWIWMLVDCAQNEPSEGNDKVIWILVIIFTHWLGALIYFFARRPQRIQLYGK